MSSHYIYVSCQDCAKSESVYTGDIDTWDFDSSDWEQEFIIVPRCIACKAKEAERLSSEHDTSQGTSPKATS